MIKPRDLKAYGCPECGAIILDSQDAVVHVNTTRDQPLPLGLVYEDKTNGCVYIVYRNDRLSNTQDSGLVHGMDQQVLKYSKVLGIVLQGSQVHVNSKGVRAGFMEGKLGFVSEDLFTQIGRKTRLLEDSEGNPLKLQRTDYLLECLV